MIMTTGFAVQLLMHSLGWTLLHFCWQGALVGVMLWCILNLLGGRSSQARYCAACSAMLLMIVLPLLTFERLAGAEYRVHAAANRTAMVFDVGLSLNAGFGGANAPWTARAVMALNHAMPWLLSIWFVGALFFVVRLQFGLFAVKTLRRTGIEAPSDELLARFVALRSRLGVTRAVRLLHSTRVQVPTVVGWLKPVVLMPVSCLTGLTAAQIEAILCHELAHVRRHDYFVSVLQSVAESLLFYHPATWWVSRQIRRERECCCDEIAVANCGDALDYARALSYLEECRAARPEFALGANGGVLKMRIKRVLGSNDAAGAPQLVAVSMVAVLIVLGGCLAMKARAESTPQAAAAVSAPIAKQKVYVVRYEADGSGAVKKKVTAFATGRGGKLTQEGQVSAPALPTLSAPDAQAALAAIGATPRLFATFNRFATFTNQFAGDLTSTAGAGSPQDLTCTYYDESAHGHAGLCEGTGGAKAVYSCRASDGAHPAQEQSSCESKVKRVAALQQPKMVVPLVDGPVHVKPALMEGSQLLHKVEPVYPPIAKAAHVEGVVVMGVTIGTDGMVHDLAVASGPPMLISSAVDAVKQWVYRPFMLNGKPIEIRTSISVNFSLGDKPAGGHAASGRDAMQTASAEASPIPLPADAFVPRIAGATVPPTLTYSVEPEMTEESRKAKFKGIVLVAFHVDTNGLPQDVHVTRSVGMGLDAKAVEAVKQYKFTPAMRDGKPVDYPLHVEVNFQVF